MKWDLELQRRRMQRLFAQAQPKMVRGAQPKMVRAMGFDRRWRSERQ